MIYAQKITLHRHRHGTFPAEKASMNFLEFEDIWRAADQKLREWADQLDFNAWRPVVVDIDVVFRDGQMIHHHYNLYPPRLDRPRLAQTLTEVVTLLSGAGRAMFKPRWLHARVLGIDLQKMEWYDAFSETHVFGPPRTAADPHADERRWTA